MTSKSARDHNGEKGPPPSTVVAAGLSTRQVTWALIALWLCAIAITAAMFLQEHHGMDVSHVAPALILTLVLLVWPFALGWRPFVPPGRRMRTCAQCGTEWRPVDEGTRNCPACGALAKV